MLKFILRISSGYYTTENCTVITSDVAVFYLSIRKSIMIYYFSYDYFYVSSRGNIFIFISFHNFNAICHW